MTLKEALNRLKYTIGNENKCNKTDKIALNSILNFVNLSNEKVVEENLLFAKLYTLVLREFANNYQDVDFANKQLNKEIALPIDYQIEKLSMDLKAIQINQFFREKGIKEPWINGSNLNKIREITDENTLIFNKINIEEINSNWNLFNIESVINNLNFSINQSIQNYKNGVTKN